MSPTTRDTADPLHTGLLPDLLGLPENLPENLVGVSTTDARTLSTSLFRRLGTLEEGTAEFSYVRNTLVELNLSLVKYAARRYRARREPLEDIIQVGTIGLIKAINRFDVERGTEFATFAIPTITGEIKRFFRDTSWSVKVPRRLQELRLDIARTYDALEQGWAAGRPNTSWHTASGSPTASWPRASRRATATPPGPSTHRSARTPTRRR